MTPNVRMTAAMARRHRVEIDGIKRPLGPKLTELLAVLIMRGRNFSTMAFLCEALGGRSKSTLRVHIAHLRAMGIVVETWNGAGYRLPADDVPDGVTATKRASPTLAFDRMGVNERYR